MPSSSTREVQTGPGVRTAMDKRVAVQPGLQSHSAHRRCTPNQCLQSLPWGSAHPPKATNTIPSLNPALRTDSLAPACSQPNLSSGTLFPNTHPQNRSAISPNLNPHPEPNIFVQLQVPLQELWAEGGVLDSAPQPSPCLPQRLAYWRGNGMQIVGEKGLRTAHCSRNMKSLPSEKAPHVWSLFLRWGDREQSRHTTEGSGRELPRTNQNDPSTIQSL